MSGIVSKMTTKHIVLALVALLLVIGVTTVFFGSSNNEEPLDTNQSNIMTNNSAVVEFQGVEYHMPVPEQEVPGTDYTAVFKEVVPVGESLESWTTLITSQQLTPLPDGPVISAEGYAGNLLQMHGSQGAQVLETLVLSNPEWESVGIDTTNPPFLLVYVYNVPESDDAELSIAVIRNTADKNVEAVIYSKRFLRTDINEFLQSEEYMNTRIAVVTLDSF